MDILKRNNVHVSGPDSEATVIYAHGFGCNQQMWNQIEQAFNGKVRQVLFDYVGSGQSELSQYDEDRYSSLRGYAHDVLDVCDALELTSHVIFVGHSVSCSIGAIASNLRPGLFSAMVMVGPSPCFLNHPPNYTGGFEHEDLVEMIELIEQNYIGWANYLAPVVAGGDTEIAGHLSDSFCSTDPVVAKQFAEATFFADNRDDFARLTPPVLVLHHQRDALVPDAVRDFLQQTVADCKIETLDVTGHAAHLCAPELVIKAMKNFLAQDITA